MTADWEHAYNPYKTWGKMGVDYQERVNFERLRKERLEKARAKMQEYGFDVLLLMSGDNIRYSIGSFDSGWRTFMRYCILPLKADPILFETVGPDTENTLLSCPWLKGRVRPSMVWRGAWSAGPHMTSKFAEGVKAALKEEGLENSRIGADLLDRPSAAGLAKAGLKIDDASQVMNKARIIKTHDEIELLKKACYLVDCTYDLVRHEWAKPGVTEEEVGGEISRFLLSNSGDTYLGNVSSGVNTNPYYRAGRTDKMIRGGDMLIVDIITRFLGYTADFARSWLIGAKPTKEHKEVYRSCYDSLYASMNAVKPGATTKDVAEHFIENEESLHGTTSLIQGGHGLGLTSQEGFWITRGHSLEFPEKLEKNMCLAIETYSTKPGFRDGVRLEENFVVTETGYQVLSQFPFEEEMLN